MLPTATRRMGVAPVPRPANDTVPMFRRYAAALFPPRPMDQYGPLSIALSERGISESGSYANALQRHAVVCGGSNASRSFIRAKAATNDATGETVLSTPYHFASTEMRKLGPVVAEIITHSFFYLSTYLPGLRRLEEEMKLANQCMYRRSPSHPTESNPTFVHRAWERGQWQVVSEEKAASFELTLSSQEGTTTGQSTSRLWVGVRGMPLYHAACSKKPALNVAWKRQEYFFHVSQMCSSELPASLRCGGGSPYRPYLARTGLPMPLDTSPPPTTVTTDGTVSVEGVITHRAMFHDVMTKRMREGRAVSACWFLESDLNAYGLTPRSVGNSNGVGNSGVSPTALRLTFNYVCVSLERLRCDSPETAEAFLMAYPLPAGLPIDTHVFVFEATVLQWEAYLRSACTYNFGLTPSPADAPVSSYSALFVEMVAAQQCGLMDGISASRSEVTVVKAGRGGNNPPPQSETVCNTELQEDCVDSCGVRIEDNESTLHSNDGNENVDGDGTHPWGADRRRGITFALRDTKHLPSSVVEELVHPQRMPSKDAGGPTLSEVASPLAGPSAEDEQDEELFLCEDVNGLCLITAYRDVLAYSAADLDYGVSLDAATAAAAS